MNEQDIKEYTPTLTLTRHTGLLLAYRQQHYSFTGEPRKLRAKLIEITIKNLILGWWGVRSMIINPAIIIENIINYFSYKKEYQAFMLSPKNYINKAKDAENKIAINSKNDEQREKRQLIVWSIILLVVMVVLTFIVVNYIT